MAEKTQGKKLQVRRKSETVRERQDKSTKKSANIGRTRKIASSTRGTVAKVSTTLKKEYNPIKNDSNKVASYFTRSRRFTPGYVLQSFRELKHVTWPSKRTAARLTFAVFAFSVVFSSIIRGIDYGFERLFKDVILK